MAHCKNGCIHYDDYHIHIFILQAIHQTWCHILDAPPSVWWNRRRNERWLLRPHNYLFFPANCISLCGGGERETRVPPKSLKSFFSLSVVKFSVALKWNVSVAATGKGGEAATECKHVCILLDNNPFDNHVASLMLYLDRFVVFYDYKSKFNTTLHYTGGFLFFICNKAYDLLFPRSRSCSTCSFIALLCSVMYSSVKLSCHCSVC